MSTLNEKQVIKHLINVIHTSLQELNEANNLYGDSDFRTGQIYAYAECLEILQLCPIIRSTYLNYNIEERYPLK